MGGELPLVVVDNPFGILLAEKPRLRINSIDTVLHHAPKPFFFSLRYDFYTAILLMVEKLDFKRESLRPVRCSI